MIISINKAYFSHYQPSPLIISSTYVGWECEKYALLIEIVPAFFNHCHSYTAVHFLEMFFYYLSTLIILC